MKDTCLAGNVGRDHYASKDSSNLDIPNGAARVDQYSKNAYQENEIVPLASTLQNCTDTNPKPPCHDHRTVDLDYRLRIDWSLWMFKDGHLVYPQGDHFSVGAREPPHNVHAATAPNVCGYLSATPPSSDVATPNHNLPETKGMADRDRAMASTSIGGVAGRQPAAAPPLTPRSSAVKSPLGDSMADGGRSIGATNGETPSVAIGRAPATRVTSPEAIQHRAQGPVIGPDVLNMEQRLLAEGVERTVVERCIEIFKQGVTIGALETQMTTEECKRYGAVGKRFRQLLEMVGGEGMRTRHLCRLCKNKEYRNHRDALRHLLETHFHIGYTCEW